MAETSDQKLQRKMQDLEKKFNDLRTHVGELETRLRRLEPTSPDAFKPAPPVVQTRNRPKY
jgi:hypothetical protein